MFDVYVGNVVQTRTLHGVYFKMHALTAIFLVSSISIMTAEHSALLRESYLGNRGKRLCWTGPDLDWDLRYHRWSIFVQDSLMGITRM